MRIRKVSPEIPLSGNVENTYGNSQVDAYAQEYQNEHNVIVSPTTPTTSERVWLKKSKNLIQPLNSKSTAGLTISTNENGETTITGTSTYGFDYDNNIYIKLKAGTYTFSVNMTGNVPANSSQIILRNSSTSTNIVTINLWGSTTKQFTLTEDTIIDILRFYSGSNYTYNISMKLQLEEGTTATTYEPYVTPSINVDNEEIYSTDSLYGTSLYSNSSGTHEAFTLSEDIKHFREIEIIFGRSSWANMKQKLRVVPQQSGTTPCGLFAMYPSSNSSAIVVAGALMEIGSGGTNVSFPRILAGSITTTGYVAESGTYLNVYEVVGYK